MKTSALFIIALVLGSGFFPVQAQTILHGVFISYPDSLPLAGVQVITEEGESQISAEDGSFHFEFPNRKAGDQVQITALKGDYYPARISLPIFVTIPDRPEEVVLLEMCVSGKCPKDEMYRNFRQSLRENIDQYKSEINRLPNESEKIAVLEDSLLQILDRLQGKESLFQAMIYEVTHADYQNALPATLAALAQLEAGKPKNAIVILTQPDVFQEISIHQAQDLHSNLEPRKSKVSALLTLAHALVLDRQISGAEAIYELALAADPSNFWTHYAYGSFLMGLKRNEEMLRHCKQLLRLAPSPLYRAQVLQEMAIIHLMREEFQECLEAITEARDIFVQLADSVPHSEYLASREVFAHSKLAEYYFFQDRMEETEQFYLNCIRDYRTLVLRNPASNRLQKNMMSFYEKVGLFYLIVDKPELGRAYLDSATTIGEVLVKNDYQKNEINLALAQLSNYLAGQAYLDSQLVQALENGYQSILRQKAAVEGLPNDYQLKMQMGDYLSSLGDIYQEIKETDSAVTQYEQALAIFEQSKRLPSLEHESKMALSQICSKLGLLLLANEEQHQAVPYFQRVLSELEEFDAPKVVEADLWFEMERSYYNLAKFYYSEEEWEEMLKYCIPLAQFYENSQLSEEYKSNLVANYVNISAGLLNLGQLDQALVYGKKAWAKKLEGIDGEYPFEQLFYGMSMALLQRGDSFQEASKLAEARQDYQSCLSLMQEAAPHFPLDSMLKSNHFVALRKMGLVCLLQENPEESLKYNLLALDPGKELLARNPKSRDWIYEMSKLYYSLGEGYEMSDQPQAAIKSFQEALIKNFELSELMPDELFIATDQGLIYSKLGQNYWTLQEVEKAIENYTAALALEKELYLANPESEVLLENVASCCYSLGEICLQFGRYEEAREYWGQYLELGEEYYRRNSNSLDNVVMLWRANYNIGRTLYNQEEYEISLKYFKNALHLYLEIYEMDLDQYQEEHKNVLAYSCGEIGVIHAQIEEHDSALIYFENNLQIREELRTSHPQAETSIWQLAYAQVAVGKTLQNLGNLKEAKPFYLESLQLRQALFLQDSTNLEFYAALGQSWYLLGNLALERGNRDSSLWYFRKVEQVSHTLTEVDHKSSFLEEILLVHSKIEDLLPPAERVIRLQNQIESLEASQKDSLYSPRILANLYGSLSWYLLMDKRFNEAEKAARTGIALGAKHDLSDQVAWIHTNLAAALLFQGKYRQSEKVYQQFLGQQYYEEQSWQDIFLEDLEALEAAGITHPDVEKIRSLIHNF